ncbi:MAG: hypothetical protein HDT42_09370 [Ruminococcaceae bacterium]|nr:hypothetical protein [Oscillospiraceae bacterium]
MSKKKRKSAEQHTDEVLSELFGNIEDVDSDIENDITELGDMPDDDIKTAEPPKKNRFFFGFAIFTVIMAVIGIISCVSFVSGAIRNIVDNTSLKNEFARFLLPVVANDIPAFEQPNDLPDSVKIRCSVWNILINKDISDYKVSLEGQYQIPEYDIDKSCKELFGSEATLNHRTINYGDLQFSYSSDNHVYNCARDLRYLNYAPKITDMTEENGVYKLTVEYISPSLSMLAEDLDLESTADKSMIYNVTRVDGKITLLSVDFPPSSYANGIVNTHG